MVERMYVLLIRGWLLVLDIYDSSAYGILSLL